MTTRKNNPDLLALRSKLDSARGKEYWRGLEELTATEEFQDFLHREFPEQATEWNDPMGRRKFLRLMGASLALAGLSACTIQPTEKIVPYVTPPEEMIPGKPLFFATAMQLAGVATGLLVESHMGRPTKVEGNPDHPASLGATDTFAQASVLTLYDPDRSQTVTHVGNISTWSAFLGALRPLLDAQMALGGAGLRILTETVTSPSLADQMRAVLASFPSAKWHQYDPEGRDNARAGSQAAFGQAADAVYYIDRADVILSLDADFLDCHPGNLRYIREFASRRKVSAGQTSMNRLYAVEVTPSNTGGVADHRLAVRPSQFESFARAVAAAVGAQAGQAAPATEHNDWIAALARDLSQHRGTSLVIPGEHQPPVVHALAHAMNQALGNVGKTVSFIEPIEANPVNQAESMRELAADMQAGRVSVLLIVGGNPVYTAPVDLNFGELLRNIEFTVHLSLYNDETSALCKWHIPEAHYLESWGDARAYDGTVSIMQPLIAPLYNGKTANEMLTALTTQPERRAYDIVRDYWMRQMRGGSFQLPQASGATPSSAAPSSAAPSSAATSGASTAFETAWRKALFTGVIPNTASPQKSLAVRADWASQQSGASQAPAEGYEIIFRPDPTVYDGRFANNAWLQELPKPLTKLTWDNVALISRGTAEKLGLQMRVGTKGGDVISDVVELVYKDRSVRAPIWILPGQPDDVVTVHLGYGRDRAGRVGNGTGYNAYAIRTSDAPWSGAGLDIRKTGDTYTLATTQLHHYLEGRDLVRSGSVEEFKSNPHMAREQVEEPAEGLSLYPEYDYSNGYRWGMAIDLSACVGCNACVVACQAENNIPVVGKQEVLRSREMHWLRVDAYYKGESDNPQTYFQAVPCMHCEKAPCEVVCPVAATVHSAEGLNDMVYNRCVGTRYCSNNCPYKVRRFNFLLYSDFVTESTKLGRNPDVTVRSRGVMEKCTYCVQRINHARIESEKERRRVRDGEIVTACAAACPADAIVFGDINDSASRVAKLKAEPRNYGLLADLNTQPRTTYLAALRNPNPEIGGVPTERHEDEGKSTYGSPQ
jgi:molybdopterin-containing oxidoreductase family iron-sulfur binding subunit